MAGTFERGYVVLTKQLDDTWRDDWDGEVHVESYSAVAAYRHAIRTCGPDRVLLCKVTLIEDEQ